MSISFFSVIKPRVTPYIIKNKEKKKELLLHVLFAIMHGHFKPTYATLKSS